MFKQTLATSLVLAAAQASNMNQRINTELSQLGAQPVDTDDYTLNVDYCVESGSYEYTTAWEEDTYFNAKGREDNYFNSETYKHQSASKKLTDLWTQLTENQTVACQQFGGLTDLFRQRPYESLQHEGDEMPFMVLVESFEEERTQIMRRKKLVHQQGLVAKAVFKPTEDHPYTGIFKSGAENMIIRLSEADLIVPDVSSGLTPSVALKFLRTNQLSANQFGMVSFEPQSGEWDFFANNFQSHLPEHSGECGPQSFAKFNGSAFPQVFQTGSVDMARWDEDGNEVALDDVNFPFYLRIKPVRKTRGGKNVPPITNNQDSTWFEQLEGSSIPEGTHLFDVYALDSPPTCEGKNCTPRTPQEVPDHELQLIGRIRSASEFTQSLWGDERLFFQHGKFKNDSKSDEGGDPDNLNQHTLAFDENRWGRYPRETWMPPSIDDEGVLTGMVNNGCPFQWIIDGLASI